MYGNTNDPKQPEQILRKKNGTGGINLPEVRQYYKAAVIKTVWYWHINKKLDLWNKIQSLAVNPYTYEHLIFDKEGKNEKRQILQ